MACVVITISAVLVAANLPIGQEYWNLFQVKNRETDGERQ